MANIKMLVMDVDGTLTDGKIYMSADGEAMKAFNIKDGYGIVHLREYGIIPVIITGRSSEIVANRCKELHIDELHQGVEDKNAMLEHVCVKYKISTAEVAYIGDDLNDMECISLCGTTAAPADAMAQVLNCVDYVCKHNGGDGAVREFIDVLIKK